MRKDTTTQLADVEASMRRWQTRLNRAVGALNKLDRKRRRLQTQIGKPPTTPFVMEVPQPTKTLAERSAEQKAAKQEAISTDDPNLVEKVAAALDIPTFLKREAVDVEQLKAKRKSKEEADKHKMPLTGRAALEAVRPKRKKA